jgi:hypothetical protein
MPSTDGTTQVYTGDGTSGIYIWGAQLSDSASLDPYVYNPAAAFTSTAYYGPRFDYDPTTLAPRGLLIEEQRTNSIRNNTMVGAVAGTPGTVPTNWIQTTLGVGLTANVVGVGTSSGINYIDIRIFGTPADAAGWAISTDANTQIAASSGQVWTGSSYIAIVGGSSANIPNGFARVIERNSGGGYVTESNVSWTGATSVLANNRFSVTRTLGGTAAFVQFSVYFGTTIGAAIDITLRIGLPQLEQGAFATSVIPTTTAAATRTADVATMVGANFSNWYNQTEGSFYGECLIPFDSSASIFPIVVAAADGTFSNTIALYARTVDDARFTTVRVGGVEQANITSGTAYVYGTVSKQATAYKINDFATSVGGAAVGTDTSGTVPVVDRLGFGTTTVTGGALSPLNGHIRRIAYFPTRLTNAQLQALTV